MSIFRPLYFGNEFSLCLKFSDALPVAQFSVAPRDPVPGEVDEFGEVEEHRE